MFSAWRSRLESIYAPQPGGNHQKVCCAGDKMAMNCARSRVAFRARDGGNRVSLSSAALLRFPQSRLTKLAQQVSNEHTINIDFSGDQLPNVFNAYREGKFGVEEVACFDAQAALDYFQMPDSVLLPIHELLIPVRKVMNELVLTVIYPEMQACAARGVLECDFAFYHTERKSSDRSQSGFKDQGVLTPEEFVLAGDYLVRTCPTWAWDAGEASKAKPYLPKNKQYLVTRNVPCHRRAAAVEGYADKVDSMVTMEGGEEGDAWVAMEEHNSRAQGSEEHIPFMGDEPAEHSTAHPTDGASAEDEDDEDIPDIDDLALEDAEQDEAALPSQPTVVRAEDGEEHILRTRTYDLLISYDKYYQVPRFWLVGYDESRQLLRPNQVLDDVSEEHARKTITPETFPHGSFTAASIHPCKHAVTMKKLGTMLTDGGKDFRVDHYLVLFLKFIASVVPTIEYDYTMAVGL
ncbi:hypothetical protein WJX72_007374 [[Myrmecia] bisecta]|uniref:Autophagy-related protein 3 n=1 Tax=[Myrmecia] bisecta TaxID=41462 RepID=A0AAW1PHV1_9CHLO